MHLHILGLLLTHAVQQSFDDLLKVRRASQRAAVQRVDVSEIHTRIHVVTQGTKLDHLVHRADLRLLAHGLGTEDEAAVSGFLGDEFQRAPEHLLRARKSRLPRVFSLRARVEYAAFAAKTLQHFEGGEYVIHGIFRLFGFRGREIDKIRSVDADLDAVLVAFRAYSRCGRGGDAHSPSEGILKDVQSPLAQPLRHIRGGDVSFCGIAFGMSGRSE